MARRPARRWDILGSMALAAAATLAVLAGGNSQPASAVLGVALALVLPGYLLSSMLVVDLGRTDRVVWTIGLSLVATVLAGLVLDLTPWGLHSGSWAVALGGISLLSGLGAIFRGHRGGERAGSSSPYLTLGSIVGFGISSAIVAVAVVVAVSGAAARDDSFTQFWAVPQNSPGQYRLQVGIANDENTEVTYRLEIDRGGSRATRWSSISVQPGREWVDVIDLGTRPSDAITVLLYRSDAPSTLYRWVKVSPASFTGGR